MKEYEKNVQFIVCLKFRAREGVQAFSLGELNSCLKNIMTEMKKAVHESTKIDVRSKLTKEKNGEKSEMYFNVFVFYVDFDEDMTDDFQMYEESVREMDLSIKLSQKPSQYKTAKHLNFELQLIADISQKFLSVLFFLPFIQKLNISEKEQIFTLATSSNSFKSKFHFDELSTLLYSNLFSEDLTIENPYFNFGIVRKALLNEISSHFESEDFPEHVKNGYARMIEYLDEISEILFFVNNKNEKLVSKVAVDFYGCDIMGLMPTLEDITKEIKNRKNDEVIYSKTISRQREMKVVVLGANGVGKSSTVVMFINGTFVQQYDPTIEDSYRKQISIDDNVVLLEILDTCYDNTITFSAMYDLYLRNGQAFLIIFDVTRKETVNTVKDAVANIKRVKENRYVPIVIAGNKIDLADQRVVTTEEGKQLALELNASYFDTSAKLRTNNTEQFEELVRGVWDCSYI